ncbi:MAG: RagB/SusD family nutrient uptake outer membrane protein, partial [Prevotella sp.]|nr:RagB/SusD family nutrient uptake outer membrane protein [Prevotella sp.]
MKKYIAICLVGAAMLTSCGNDWLDLEPSTSTFTETSVLNGQDCYASLNGIYSTMQSAYAYSGRLVYYGDAAGDDMQALSPTKRTGNVYLLSFTKNNVQASYWSYPYSMIGACNNILAQIDKIDEDDQDLIDFYKGQALALRGMFLFDLTKVFGYPYKKDNGASLGVPVVKEVLDRNAKPKRNTVAED